MSETLARHSIGGNTPPLSELLSKQYADLLRDADTLIASADRAPTIVTDDELLGKFGKLVVKLREVKSRAEAAHKIEKEPYLSGGRQVDSFFNNVISRAKEAMTLLERRQGVFMAEKEAAERKRQREAEDAARAEADAKLKAAQEAQSAGHGQRADAAFAQAVEAENAANDAARLATAKPAELVRIHTASGNTITSQEKWDCEIINCAEIPLEAIRAFIPSDAIERAVRAFVKNGGRELKGVRIFEARKVVNRA